MAENEKELELDALLDSLLRSYSAAEPRPGFETRLRTVVSEPAMRARRTNWRMLAASAAAIALFAWMMVANPHKTKEKIAGPTVARDSFPAAATTSQNTFPIQMTSPAKNRGTIEGTTKISNDQANRLVLQMVEATQGNRSLVFEHEKLYLTPEKPSETETAAASEQETQAPAGSAVSIKSIGVASIESNAPIEIKDLAPPKSSTEKGSL